MNYSIFFLNLISLLQCNSIYSAEGTSLSSQAPNLLQRNVVIIIPEDVTSGLLQATSEDQIVQNQSKSKSDELSHLCASGLTTESSQGESEESKDVNISSCVRVSLGTLRGLVNAVSTTFLGYCFGRAEDQTSEQKKDN